MNTEKSQFFNSYKPVSSYLWVRVKFEVYSIRHPRTGFEVIAKKTFQKLSTTFFVFENMHLTKILKSKETDIKKALSKFETMPNMELLFNESSSVYAKWIEKSKKEPATRAQTVQLIKYHLQTKNFSKFEASITLSTFFAARREEYRKKMAPQGAW